VTPNAAH
jgi:hypothetical protein